MFPPTEAPLQTTGAPEIPLGAPVTAPLVDADLLAAQEEEARKAEDEFQKKLAAFVKDTIAGYELKDRSTRETLIRQWRKCELYWEGIQNLIWDGQDYRSAAAALDKLTDSTIKDDFDPYYYDKIVNVYRAYGESVGAAITQEVPSIIFPPDDAGNQDDVLTSKAYEHISELVKKHNKAPMLLLKAFFKLWNQGMAAAYTYTHVDNKYGTYNVDKTSMVPQEYTVGHMCPMCGGPLDLADQSGLPIDTDNLDTAGETQMLCPACEQIISQDDAIPQTTTIKVPKITGYDTYPKSRECIEVYGPLQVFIPSYCTEQKFVPVAVLKTDCHYTFAKELYPNIADKIGPSPDEEDAGNRLSRSFPESDGDYDQEQTTIKQCWLRPWTANAIRSDPDFYREVRKRYPKGLFVVLVGDELAKVQDEDLDECWTFTVNPLSTHLHAKPLGAPLLPIQDIRNELVLLKLQSVEYGIPETFAESTAINWNAYKQNPARPGMLYPAKSKAGQNLDGSFATLKTATFPQESIEFQKELDSDGQFVVGAFPSIYGGAMPGGGKTAAEYQMSQNRALQRLSIIYKMISWWWADVISKSCQHFHENLLSMGQDASYSVRKGNTWEAVWIRREELVGKVGSVEPEAADTFPMSWSQRRDILMQLIQLNDPDINAAIFHQENLSLVKNYGGLREMYIPGEDDRNKQLNEIELLLQSPPFDEMHSSIPIDPMLDNNQAEMTTCQVWMKSDKGQDAKMNNPAGFANVRAHAAEHFMVVQMQLQAEQEQQNKENPNDKSKSDSGGSVSS